MSRRRIHPRTGILSALLLLAVGAVPVSAAYLALGDSYTIGESVAPEERWPAVLTRQLAASGADPGDVVYVARTGWSTGDLLRALDRTALEPPYALVSLLIGVNDQYRGGTVDAFRRGFAELLRRAVTLAGGRRDRVFAVSIPDYGYTPFGRAAQPAISREIDAFNAAAADICRGQSVRFIVITDITRRGLAEPALVADDGLHPSGRAYRLAADRMLPLVLPMLRPAAAAPYSGRGSAVGSGRS